MKLRPATPEIGGLYTFSLLQDGYSLPPPASRLGTVTLGDLAHVGADQAGRLWDAVVAAAHRGGARVVERRKQEAMRHIRRVRVQCGYAHDPSQV
jgi:hypothetical protein